MNDDQKAFVARWVKALRDGSYTQGQGYLKIPIITPDNNDGGMEWSGTYGYCCLGVACDLVDHNAWEDTQGDDNFVYWQSDGWGLLDVFPPRESFQEWTGLTADAMDELAGMNDRGENFGAIADKIDAMANGTDMDDQGFPNQWLVSEIPAEQ